MRGRDKLLETVDDLPLLRRVANAAWESQASEIVVVLGARAEVRQAALDGLVLRVVTNRDWQAGMGGSIRIGIEGLGEKADAALILLADMPDVSVDLINSLITVFDPERGLDIVRPRAASGVVGNPILLGKRHFPALAALSGDVGAKAIIAANPDSVLDLPIGDDSVLVDLDTPEAWAKWRSDQQG